MPNAAGRRGPGGVQGPQSQAEIATRNDRGDGVTRGQAHTHGYIARTALKTISQLIVTVIAPAIYGSIGAKRQAERIAGRDCRELKSSRGAFRHAHQGRQRHAFTVVLYRCVAAQLAGEIGSPSVGVAVGAERETVGGATGDGGVMKARRNAAWRANRDRHMA